MHFFASNECVEVSFLLGAHLSMPLITHHSQFLPSWAAGLPWLVFFFFGGAQGIAKGTTLTHIPIFHHCSHEAVLYAHISVTTKRKLFHHRASTLANGCFSRFAVKKITEPHCQCRQCQRWVRPWTEREDRQVAHV